MYHINKKNCCGEVLNNHNFSCFPGFLMPYRGRGFKINGSIIKNIKVIDRKMSTTIVTNKVLKKYDKLIFLLTELLISDDDTGDTFREALNHIEKFRLEIKIKYREFLKKKELEMMSKQLSVLKKESENRLIEIHNSYTSFMTSGKGK